MAQSFFSTGILTMCPLLELDSGPKEEEVGFFWRVRLRMS
jgi:hypothetical protein